MTTTTTTEELILQTSASGAPVRLEYVRGRMKWEASPASLHQKTARRIERSITPIPGQSNGCACYDIADTLIRFPDPEQSLKRPDIAIFCEEPPDSNEALDMLPAAVIEIISVGYEEKDLGPDGAPFYLAYGIEVLVVDPRRKVLRQYRPGQPMATLQMPITIDLLCGCRLSF